MKSWQLAIVCLAFLAAGGCRSDPSVALLERENRELEDQIYQLADRVEKCDRQNANLRGQLARAGVEPGAQVDRTRPPGIAEPARTGRGSSDVPFDPDALPSPTPEMPSEEMPADKFLERFSPAGGRDVPENPRFPAALPPASDPVPSHAPATEPAPSDGSAMEPASSSWSPPELMPTPQGRRITVGENREALQIDNTPVAGITLHDTVTGGYNMDGQAGDEGIVAVVQPRDADGRLIEAPAPVSVVVLDPALSGQAARVARWDFTAEEVAARYRRNGTREGIRLEMVWPADPPQHGRLHLFVRYRTDDGRALEADREIHVEGIDVLARRDSPAGGAQPLHEANRAAPEWQRKPAPPVESPPPEAVQTASPPIEPLARPPAASEPDRRRPTSGVQRPIWSPERR